jgi:hypothetical protein
VAQQIFSGWFGSSWQRAPSNGGGATGGDSWGPPVSALADEAAIGASSSPAASALHSAVRAFQIRRFEPRSMSVVWFIVMSLVLVCGASPHVDGTIIRQHRDRRIGETPELCVVTRAGSRDAHERQRPHHHPHQRHPDQRYHGTGQPPGPKKHKNPNPQCGSGLPVSRDITRNGTERVTGIEPAFSAWEADVLPLNYTRIDDGSPSKSGDRLARGRRSFTLKIGGPMVDHHCMTRSPLRLAIAVAMALAGTRWVIDTNPWSGPTVVRFTETHGVHTNDWVTIALWGASVVVACPVWARTSVRRLQHARIDRSA